VLRAAALHSSTEDAINVATTHGYTTAFLVSAGISYIGLPISIVVTRVSTTSRERSLKDPSTAATTD
jgi:hypothetical protein